MLFSRLDFPNNVCKSTESVAVHTHRSHTLVGQFIMERKHGVNLTVSDPAVYEIYDKSHGH